MDIIDVNNIKENDMIKFITPNKKLVDGTIKKISKDFLGVTINTRQDSYLILSKNQPINLILANDQKAIKCTSVILGCTQNDFEQAVIISIPKIILGIDRREYTRLPIIMDIEYSPLPFEATYDKVSKVEPKFFRYFRKTYTVNISGGGVYFVVPKSEIDSKLALISLSLRDEKIVSLCEKVRADNADDMKHQRVAYKFNDIKTNHRQLILDFISEKSKENLSI